MELTRDIAWAIIGYGLCVCLFGAMIGYIRSITKRGDDHE
jgi:hypothetical protein